MRRIVRNALSLSIVLAASLLGEGPTTRPTYAPVAPGIERAELITRSAPDAQPMRVWIYRPAAKVADATWPCIFVASGGSNGTIGVALDEADVPEHTVYAREGSVVVAYDLDGAPGEPLDGVASARAFVRSDGGMANLRAAITLAKEAEPSIDPHRMYAAGHDSAGALALCAAATMDEIRGAVAYSPTLDPTAALGNDMIEATELVAPGFRTMLESRSASSLVKELHKPVMLFAAADDDRLPIASVREFATRLEDAGNRPLLVEVPTGGHVGAMLTDGLKAGAAWMADRARRDSKAPSN